MYIYDESGAPIGYRHRNAGYAEGKRTNYWYEKNLHGGIVAVYNDDGEKLAAYIYETYSGGFLHFYRTRLNRI